MCGVVVRARRVRGVQGLDGVYILAVCAFWHSGPTDCFTAYWSISWTGFLTAPRSLVRIARIGYFYFSSPLVQRA